MAFDYNMNSSVLLASEVEQKWKDLSARKIGYFIVKFKPSFAEAL